MYLNVSSFKCANPQQRKERIANDAKYQLKSTLAATTGGAAALAVLNKPELIDTTKTAIFNGYNKAGVYANKLKNTAVATKAATLFQKAKGKVAPYLDKLKNTSLYNSAKATLAPVTNWVKQHAASIAKDVKSLGADIAKGLSKVPKQYVAAGAIALVTLALINKFSHTHAYNEGKIDAKYEN